MTCRVPLEQLRASSLILQKFLFFCFFVMLSDSITNIKKRELDKKKNIYLDARLLLHKRPIARVCHHLLTCSLSRENIFHFELWIVTNNLKIYVPLIRFSKENFDIHGVLSLNIKSFHFILKFFFNIPTRSPTYDSKNLLSWNAKPIPWILDCFKCKKMSLSQGKFGPYVTIRTNMPITRSLMVPQGQLNTKEGQARRLSLEHW